MLFVIHTNEAQVAWALPMVPAAVAVAKHYGPRFQWVNQFPDSQALGFCVDRIAGQTYADFIVELEAVTEAIGWHIPETSRRSHLWRIAEESIRLAAERARACSPSPSTSPISSTRA